VAAAARSIPARSENGIKTRLFLSRGTISIVRVIPQVSAPELAIRFIPLMAVILLWDGLSSAHFPLAPSLAQQLAELPAVVQLAAEQEQAAA
jgi:hypothetical protein